MKTISLHKVLRKLSAFLMIATLAWLTISLPCVYRYQQQASRLETKEKSQQDPSNPLANTTEEKTSTSSSLTEEYIHHTEEMLHPVEACALHHVTHSYDVYIAFHGELIYPPPEA